MAQAGTLTSFADAEALARAAAAELERRVRAALAAQGRCDLALAGGSTPRRLYELLPAELRWEYVHLWFGDERCVPPEHADSNYRMVEQSLLARVPIPSSNVHRMRGDDLKPAREAARYERELVAFFGLRARALPRFDLVLLGLGADGHTASLFPGTAALEEREKLCVANWVPRLGSWRLTLTLPVLNAARAVLFLVAGADKRAALAAALTGDVASSVAARVQPAGELLWWTDAAARGAPAG